MDFTNLFQSTMQANVGENTLLNNLNGNDDNNNFMVPTSSSSNSHSDDDIAKFLMEAEAFLLNENPPPPNSVSIPTTTNTTTNLTPPMPAFEFQQFDSNPTVSTLNKESITQQPSQQPMISFFQSSDTHITMVNPMPSQQSTSSSSSTPSRKPTTPAQRRQANRMREPIFVTEAPQNAYKKKKKSRTSSSDDDDSDEDAAQLKKMTSKQRRQLRNKISARNFRVRRKEYIEQLESQVEKQDKEIETLKLVNTKLEKVNQELFQELQYWRTMVPTPPGTTSSNTSDNNSTPSPPQTTFPPLDLDQFSLFDFSGDTHVAHAAIPDFDFSQIFNDKLLTNGTSSDGGEVPEDHELDAEGNIVLKPIELIKVYPLFVPALLSMIVRHTFTLHYAAYFTSTLEAPKGNDKMLDLLGQHEWMQQAFVSGAAVANNTAITASGNRRRGSHNSEVEKTHLKERRGSDGSIQEEIEEQEDEEERRKVDDFIKEHYLHYAFWRMCGLSHQQVYNRFLVCYRANGECAQKYEHKQEKKWSKANLQRQMSTMSAYVTVSNTVLHHPERLPLIASVLKRNNFTKITSQQQKSFLSLPTGRPSSSTPSVTAGPSSSRKKTFPLLKTIKLGGSSRRD